jgi:predicted GIY-YIG superfamily endonuclease
MIFGTVYCLKSSQTDKIYIGSTTQKLKRRLTKHKSDYRTQNNRNGSYITSFEIVKYADVYIEELVAMEFESKYAMQLLERFYIEQNKGYAVNQKIPTRIQSEYMKSYYFEKRRDRIICSSCNGKYTINSMVTHFNTQKHKMSLT